MTKNSRKRKLTDLTTGGNRSAHKTSEARGTGAGGYESTIESGDDSSTKQSVPSLRQNKSPKSRKSRSAGKMKKKENGEASSNIEKQSKQLRHRWTKYNSENKKSSNRAPKILADFKKRLQVKHKNLDFSAKEREAQLGSQRVSFTKNFRDIYCRIFASETASKSNDQQLKPDFDTSAYLLQQRSIDVIDGATSLIEQFQSYRVELELQETSLPTHYNWKDGAKSLKYIIDIGRQIGEQKVANILCDSRTSPTDSKAAGVSELLYGRDEPQAQEETWADVVRKQERGIMRLVSSLPQG